MRAPIPANWARQPSVEVKGDSANELIQNLEEACFLRLFLTDASWPMQINRRIAKIMACLECGDL
jgi:hypothetical protein